MNLYVPAHGYTIMLMLIGSGGARPGVGGSKILNAHISKKITKNNIPSLRLTCFANTVSSLDRLDDMP